MAERELAIKITAAPENARRGLKAVGDESAKMGKEVERNATKAREGISKFGAGAAVGMGLFVKSSIGAAQESQRISKITAAVVKSTGGAANMSAGQIGDLAENLSNLTGVDDELIQSSSNVLLTFTNVRNEVGKNNDIFTQAQKSALDLSTVMGGDLQGATTMLGKALNDPIAGMAKLGRAGVTFTAEQKRTVKAMAESGDLLGAQKIILGEVNREFGGSAAAAATDADRAKVAFGNLQESVGGALIPAMTVGAKAVTAVAGALSGLPGPVQAGVVGITLLGGSALYLAPKIKSGVDALKGFAEAARVAASAKGSGGLIQSMGGVSGLMGPAGVATAVAGLALYSFASDAAAAAKRAAEVKAETAGLREEMAATGKTAKEAFSPKLPALYAEHAESFKAMGISATDFKTAITGTHDEYRTMIDLTLRYGMKDVTAKQWGAAEAHVIDTRKAFIGARVEAKATGEAAKEMGIDLTGAADGADEAAGASGEFANKLTEIKSAANDAASALGALYGDQTSQLEARVAANEQLDAFTQGLKDNGLAMDENTDKGRANIGNAIALKDAAVASATAIFEQTNNAEQAKGALNLYAESLATAARSAGATDDEVTTLLTSLGLTPEQINTKFSQSGAKAVQTEADKVKAKSDAAAKDRKFKMWVDAVQAKTEADKLNTKANIATRNRRALFEARTEGTYAANAELDRIARERVARIKVEIAQGQAQNRGNNESERRDSLRRAAGSSVRMPAGLSRASAVATGGAAPTIVVNVAGSVLSERELVGVLRGAKRRGMTVGVF